jgi:hypothetical protein
MMISNLLKRGSGFCKVLIAFVVICGSVTIGASQGFGHHQKMPADDPSKPEKEQINILEEEMKAKRVIQEADREYQENLSRARDLSSLGIAVASSFKEKNVLDQDDIKKLEKVEKLAKGIRHAAGGCEDKVEMENPPKDLPAAMEMLGDLSQSLKDKVEKTPKHVISATVIDEANVLLELIRIVRTLPNKV